MSEKNMLVKLSNAGVFKDNKWRFGMINLAGKEEKGLAVVGRVGRIVTILRAPTLPGA